MKRSDHDLNDGGMSSKRILTDVTIATNNQTVPPNLQQNSNVENRQNIDPRTMQPQTTSNYFMPYNQEINPAVNYPRVWGPNPMYTYGLGMNVQNVNSFNNVNGETSGINNGERSNEGAIRTPSPSYQFNKEHFNDVVERLADSHHFRDNVQICIKWLNMGECKKETNEEFYTLTTQIFKQVWKIMMEKSTAKDEMNKVKKEVIKGLEDIGDHHQGQLKVIEHARKQKVWDMFSKGQRKQLANCMAEVEKSTPELNNPLIDPEEEEESKQKENTICPNNSIEPDEVKEFEKIREEADLFHHEIDTVQMDNNTIKIEDTEKLCNNKIAIGDRSSTIKRLEEELNKLQGEEQEQPCTSNQEIIPKVVPQSAPQVVPPFQLSNLEVKSAEFRLLALIAIFLSVHPSGASLDYIVSYASALKDHSCETKRLESLLRLYPDLFKERSVGIGYSMQKVWVYEGFNHLK